MTSCFAAFWMGCKTATCGPIFGWAAPLPTRRNVCGELATCKFGVCRVECAAETGLPAGSKIAFGAEVAEAKE